VWFVVSVSVFGIYFGLCVAYSCECVSFLDVFGVLFYFCTCVCRMFNVSVRDVYMYTGATYGLGSVYWCGCIQWVIYVHVCVPFGSCLYYACDICMHMCAADPAGSYVC